ncbi:RIP metalloprotease RseP [Coprobacter tertius]|uniref:Zinc metalloprotease n=1 Tax=Coprobacter tertius TaxID=2944915 RepID=A0ABT1MF54_9BACT|nr:RIP metalloprotease RseP [Coprobacter tertius]MCP9611268.1 RIP metalloprotease RseP [Coprobacter tertius]
METFLIKALQLILSLSILVIVHEFGHFIFARIYKIRVEKFYLFFNPWFSLFKFKPKNSETEYGIGWLPLGGYVKIAGMIDESMDKEQMAKPAQPWEFRSKPAGQRLMVMIAGVLFNFILALFIYSMITFTWGDAYLPFKNAKSGLAFSQTALEAGFRNGDIPLSADGKPLISLDGSTVQTMCEAKEVTVLRDGKEVKINLPADFMQKLIGENTRFAYYQNPVVVKEAVKGGGAAMAGLMKGDSLVAINNTSIPDITDLLKNLSAHKDETVTINFYRNGIAKETPVKVDESGKIGIALTPITEIYKVERTRYGFWESFPKGIKKGVTQLVDYVSSLKYIFTKEGAQSLGGFGAIGNLFPATWDWQTFWNMTAFLSIILAFMNILPIPALDGGHVLFLIYEVVTRRKPNEKFMEYAQIAGMAFLFALLIFANGNDIFRFFFK